MPHTVELAPVTFTKVELSLLGSVLGGDILPGLPDPFRGWFAADIEAAFNQVKDGLIRKGVIEPRTDGSIVVNMTAALPVCACLYAERIYILNYTPNGDRQKTRYFFLDAKIAVELTVRWFQEDLYTLTPYFGTDDVLERLRKGLRLQAQRAPECPSGLVPEGALREARDLARSAGAARVTELLAGTGLPERTAGQLAETLARPLGNGAVAALTRSEQGWAVDGLAVLQGQNGLWMLRPTGAGTLAATPCSGMAVRAELARLVLPPGCGPTRGQ